MAINSKRKLLITLFLMILLSSSAYAVLIPNVCATEASAQENGLSILTNVVGLDLTRYVVTSKEYPQNYNSSYFGVVPQTDVDYELISEGSKVKVLCTFANSRLQMIHVLENEGSPHVSKTATNSLESAKNFLSNYSVYTADSLYGELCSTLDKVEANKNFTITSGNTQLEVTVNNGYTTFKWTFIFNGITAPSKFVALGFNNGFLTCFVDNWQLYTIGSKSLKLPEKEAKTLALEIAKTYQWSLKLDSDAFETKNFNESNVRWIALIFDGSIGADKARSEDSLMLYPVWRVGVALSKWYGYMYGIEVDIWADTKEVRHVQEAWSTMPPSEEMPTANVTTIRGTTSQEAVATGAEPNLIMWIALSTLAVAAIGTTSAWVCSKKKLQSYNLPKQRSSKTGGTLLCILIMFIVLLSPIATVSATTRASVVWGSESTGAYGYPPYGSSWRKHSTEISLQNSIAGTITNYFYQGGYYDAYDRQGGPGSVKANILNDLAYYQSNHDCVAVVDFDHGVFRNDYQNDYGTFHYLFEDNVGTITGPWMPTTYPPRENHPENGVYDMDIYPKTTSRKVFFAFINTCMSANLTYQAYNGGKVQGMPFAWTQRLLKPRSYPGFNIADYISDNGYGDPDDGSQCYIGFPWGAASLMQRIP